MREIQLKDAKATLSIRHFDPLGVPAIDPFAALLKSGRINLSEEANGRLADSRYGSG